jgi:hypothetical protein
MRYSFLTPALTLAIAALLGACSGGGGGSDDPVPPPAPQKVSGVFIDSPVQGLRWESGQLSGITDANGRFEYFQDDAVSFYLGDILLGESTGFSVIIPVDIVSGAQSIDNPAVLNIARLVLTLDDDYKWDNGIQITEVVSDMAKGESVNFNVSTDAFTANTQDLVDRLTAATTDGAKGLVEAPVAREHLRLTIAKLLAGDYSGTYSGDGSGTWTATVNLQGDLTGSAILSSGGAPIQLFQENAVSGDGSGKAGFGASGGALGERTITFTGVFRTDGNASGSWKDDDQADAGTWLGTKNK